MSVADLGAIKWVKDPGNTFKSQVGKNKPLGILQNYKITRYDYNLTIMKSPKQRLETYCFCSVFIIIIIILFLLSFFGTWTCPRQISGTTGQNIAPLMVTYHYVKFYVSIIIHLEVININVWNFNFPIWF
jgi:hypothetical protein